jgi:hypothetical protein
MSLLKKFFELFGVKFGLLPGERYVCFLVSNFSDIEKSNPDVIEWLDGSGINNYLQGAVLPGRLDTTSGEYCVIITDPDFSVEEVSKALEMKGLKAEVKSIETAK